MRNHSLAALVALGVALVAGFAALKADAQENLKKGTRAPDFSAPASDGKTYTLKGLTADKPLLLYFIGHDCPINQDAAKFFVRLSEAYATNVNFVGVIDAESATTKKWQSEHGAKFRVLFDPSLRIIKSYKAERSPWAVLVGKDGKVIKEWQGYSTGYLNDLGASIAGASQATVKPINTVGAPSTPRYG